MEETKSKFRKVIEALIYDEPEPVRPTKQVLVIRKDLKMRRGKECSQIGHAAMSFLRRAVRNHRAWGLAAVFLAFFTGIGVVVAAEINAGWKPGQYIIWAVMMSSLYVAFWFSQPRLTKAQWDWLDNLYTKVTCQVESEEEFQQVIADAEAAGLLVRVITDKGLTEFHNVPTETCLAIGPDYTDKIDPVTGHLKLY